MKKIFALIFAVLFVFAVAGSAMATPPVNPGPGYYQFVDPGNPNDGKIKYFQNGQPENNSQWHFLGNNKQTVLVEAIAAPYYSAGGDAWGCGKVDGGWSVGAGGLIDVTAYAQGTKSADATAFATGTAFGFGFSAGIATPHFGIGASAATSNVILVGAGYGLGIDKFSWTNNPDFTFVGIQYQGMVSQGNGISINNSDGTWASAGNTTTAMFKGCSFTSSDGKLFGFDPIVPALSVGADGAGASANGYSIVSYVDFANFAAASAKTAGFSTYCADQGFVYGTGGAAHQAVVNNNGNFGMSAGQATFSYAGNGSYGAGVAETCGWTKITSGPISSSVTSFSTGHASAGVR